MSHSSIAKKIDGLLIKLKTENHSRDSDPIPRTMDISHTPSRRNRPTLGNLNSNTRKEKLTLPVSYERRNDHSIETDKKLKEIKEINGILTINGEEYRTDIADMEDIGELGKGTCGQVFKMRHKPSGAIIAVKKMRRSGNCEENKRIIMDIDVALKSHDCPFIVQCLGCFITDSEVWICMELMATCFDKLLKRLSVSIPEDVLGKVTFATVKALSYLKEKHDVIHRDVKPSNILVDERGNVKLCDFGISGRLVDSIANTRSAGCAAYMAPERIDPSKREYDIRADVWSLGITLVELATSLSPYEDCKTDFEVLAKVLHEPPPSLPNDKKYTDEFRAFVACCLIKDHEKRPKYVQLLQEPFVQRYENMTENVYEWFKCALKQPDLLGANSPGRRYTPAPPTTNSISIQRRPNQHRSLLDSHQQKIQQQQQQQLSNGGSVGPPYSASHFTPIQLPLSVPLSIPIDRLPPDGRNSFSPKHQREPFNIFQQQTDKPTIETAPEATSGRFSPFPRRLGESPPPDPGWFSPMARRRHGHGHGHPHSHPHPDNQNITPVSSPYQQRRCTNNLSERLVQDGFWSSPASSPLPIRKHYQNAPAMEQQFCTSSNTSPILLQRFFHQQKQYQQQQHQHQQQQQQPQPAVVTAGVCEDAGKDDNSTKKRYASHIKFQLVGDRMKSSRYQSPEPPPRLSRGSSQENSFSSQSPLAARRNFLEAASSTSASPSLSRRYISPSPPQPPPRRLSESSSVPGSPQHFRARFHYTPEPQRRIYNNTDVS